MRAFLRGILGCPEVIYGSYTIVPFKLDFVAKKGGMAGRVETGLLSRTLPIRPKGADCRTQGEGAVPLY